MMSQSDRYRPHGFSGSALALVLAIHVIGFTLLTWLDVLPRVRPRTIPLVVNMLSLEPPRSAPAPLPTVAAKPVVREERVFAPPALGPLPTAPIPVAAVPMLPQLPPTQPMLAAPPDPPSGPTDVADLSARLLSAPPPRYPLESRRRREQGVVVLLVVVGRDGSADAVTIAHSSGSDRLDGAARNAVKRWRWSATVRDGKPIEVRGTVRIPFEIAD